MRNILCALFLFLSEHISAQQAPIDSLLNLSTKAVHDSVKLNLYIQIDELCDLNDNLKYGRITDSLSNRLIKQAKTPAEKEKFIQKKIYAYNIICVYYQFVNKPDSLEKYRIKSFELAKTTNSRRQINSTTADLTELYTLTNRFTKAMDIYRENMRTAEQKGDNESIFFNLDGIANTYQRMRNPQKALEYYLKELKLQEKIGDKEGIGWTNIGVGQSYFNLGDYTKSLTHYLNAESYLIDKIKPEEKFRIYFKIARPYSELKKFEEARNYFFKALEINKNMHNYPSDSITRGVFYCEIGQTYFYEKNYKKAIEYKLEGIKHFGNLIHPDMFTPYFTTGEVYLALKNYDLAEKNLLKAKEIAEKRKDFHSQKIVSKTLSEIYIAKGNPIKANEFLIQYYQLKDSIDLVANAEVILFKELNYENEKKELQLKSEQEKQNVIHEEENKKQTIISYSVSAGLLLIGIFAIFVMIGLKKSKKANKIIALQKTEVEEQKHLVEEKQKEIIDSIRYARRIQTSLLPTEKYIDKNIKRLKN